MGNDTNNNQVMDFAYPAQGAPAPQSNVSQPRLNPVLTQANVSQPAVNAVPSTPPVPSSTFVAPVNDTPVTAPVSTTVSEDATPQTEEKENEGLSFADKIAKIKSELFSIEEDKSNPAPAQENPAPTVSATTNVSPMTVTVDPVPSPAPVPAPQAATVSPVSPTPMQQVTSSEPPVQIEGEDPVAPQPDADPVPTVSTVIAAADPEPAVNNDMQPIEPVAPTEVPAAETAIGQQSNNKNKRYPYSIEQLLDIVVERKASDLHITVGYPACIRVDGTLIPVSDVPVTGDNVAELILPVLNESTRDRLEVNKEVDLAYSHRDKGRFRINAFYQKQTMAGAFRLIPNKIKSIDELSLPPIYHQLTKLGQGLVLVTGPTGHGKSTTLAAIIQEINLTRPCHILTIEDPIEYVFPQAKALVAQREIHDDTHSWEIALKSALREDPNVILVGEMRDYETIAAAITLAETGHLVFATLHTNNAAQTIDRIIDVFPENQQPQIRMQLANILEAVIAQRLVPLTGGGRRAVSEIMLANPAIRSLIRESKTHQIDNVIRTSADIGMISLEHSLVKLVRDGLVTMDKAQEYAVRPEEVVRLLKA